MSFVSVICKVSSDVDVKTPIRRHIELQYGSSCASSLEPALDKLQDLRRTALLRLRDKSKQSIQSVAEYHDALYSLESRVLMAENGARVDFKWSDVSGRNRKVCSSHFERANLLFCYAALHSQIAEAADLRDEGSLKQAVISLKASSGAFEFLAYHSSMFGPAVKEAGIDLLQAYSAVMLAQAQECVIIKAERGALKAPLLAKIASRTREVYEDSLKKCGGSVMKQIIPKEWFTKMGEKVSLYDAMSQYYQGKACEMEKRFGEYVARMTYAYELLKAMSPRWGSNSIRSTMLEQYKRDRDSAIKDNNFIYHETVPSSRELNSVPTEGSISRTELQIPILADESKDLFAALVPLPVMEAKNMTESQMKGLLNVEVQRLNEATNALNAVMVSLNLPAAIQTSNSATVPDDLVVKAKNIQDLGGATALSEAVFSLPSSAERNREILEQQLSVLDDEESSDNKLRERFGDRWSRQTSNKLNTQWRQDANKMLNFLKETERTDTSLAARYQEDADNFELLSKSPDDLSESIRVSKASVGTSSAASPVGNESARLELAAVCSQLESMKADRNSLVEQLNSFKLPDSCTTKLAQQHEQHGQVSPQAILDLLNTELESVREAVRASEGQQRTLLSNLQGKSEAFFGTKSGGDSSTTGGDLVTRLCASVDRFVSLNRDVREGMKFYAEMTDRCIKGQEKIDDFCMARNTEKSELMSEITTNLSKVSLGDAPQHPSCNAASTTNTNAAQLPSRPPATYDKPTAPQPPASMPPPVAAYGAQMPPPGAAYGGQVPPPGSVYGGPMPPPGSAYGGPMPPPGAAYGGQMPPPGAPQAGWSPQVYGYGSPMPPLSHAMPGYPMAPYGYYPGYMGMPGGAYLPGAVPPQPHPGQPRPPNTPQQ